MARSIGEAFMELGVRDAKFNRALARAGDRVVRFGTTVGRVALRVAAALAAGAAAFTFFAVKAAASAEEQASKFEVVFGGAADATGKKLDAFAKQAGRSVFALRELAAESGDVIKSFGFTEKKAAELSVSLVKLAVDTASFKEKLAPDVLRAFNSALLGEREGLKRVAAFFNLAAVKAEALRLGLIKQGQELTGQAKVLATVSILNRKLADAQGDAVRTSKSLTNRTIALKAAFRDVGTRIGAVIVEETNLAEIIGKLTGIIEDNEQALLSATRAFIEFNKVLISTVGISLIRITTLFDKIGIGAELAATIAKKAFFDLNSAILGLKINTDDLDQKINNLSQGFADAESNGKRLEKKLLDVLFPLKEIPKDALDPVKKGADKAGEAVDKLKKKLSGIVGATQLFAKQQAAISGEPRAGGVGRIRPPGAPAGQQNLLAGIEKRLEERARKEEESRKVFKEGFEKGNDLLKQLISVTKSKAVFV